MRHSQNPTVTDPPSSPRTLSTFRPSRKSEWLRSALTHHYDPDPGVENEIVVLATGIDQYLQEIFHHLAYYSGDDLVSAEDFRLLCAVLGILEAEQGEEEKAAGEETLGICSRLPPELGFKEFHSRLCGYFCLRSGGSKADARLPVAEETEHIEREIRLRWPRVRRRKCVSFDLSKDVPSGKKQIHRSGSILKLDNLHRCSEESEDETDSGPQGAAWSQLEMENASLRELVEDLRAALQGSDARCLALEVAARRQGEGSPRDTGRKKAPADRDPRADRSARGTRALLRELELVRASRDGQLEEAVRFNQRLEEELGAAAGEARRLGELVSWLQHENGDIKRKAEDARSALVTGLAKVREMQGQASLVPALEGRVQELEAEIQSHRTRTRCTCKTDTVSQGAAAPMTSDPQGPSQRHSPTGRDDSCARGDEAHSHSGQWAADEAVTAVCLSPPAEEGLQRAVEGRAASDEEEERGREEGQCCLVEVKRLISRLHCCAKGCQNAAARQLLISQTCYHGNPPDGISMTAELRGRSRKSHARSEEKERGTERESELEKLLCSVGKDLQLKQEEAEMLRLELQMVETERVRLSLLEEKLADVLTLLLQLRSKNISRRALGKILMDTLEVCSKAGHGPSHSLQVLDTLCQQLLACELLCECSGGQPGSRNPRGTANPLLISC
nr:PREDICTED: EF-hand and coiled-coil domain-containing protein 1-like [Lepisosteus oculatus]